MHQIHFLNIKHYLIGYFFALPSIARDSYQMIRKNSIYSLTESEVREGIRREVEISLKLLIRF